MPNAHKTANNVDDLKNALNASNVTEQEHYALSRLSHNLVIQLKIYTKY